MTENKQAKPIVPMEVRDIQMPRIKRVKKLIDADQLASYFSAGFTGTLTDNDERNHWMLVYALLAAFDADISREAFTELAIDIINMRARLSCCLTLEMAAMNQQNAHLTPTLLSQSHAKNASGLNADASEIARIMALVHECRGQDDTVH